MHRILNTKRTRHDSRSLVLGGDRMDRLPVSSSYRDRDRLDLSGLTALRARGRALRTPWALDELVCAGIRSVGCRDASRSNGIPTMLQRQLRVILPVPRAP